MRYRWMGCLLACVLAFPTAAFGERKCDFSDIQEPLVSYPFKVIEYSTYSDEFSTYQVTRVADSYESVVKFFQNALDKRKPLGVFTVMGLTHAAPVESHNTVLAYNNEHNYLEIKPSGTGTELVLKATPNSYVSGFYQQSLFGYRLWDETVIPTGERDEDGL